MSPREVRRTRRAPQSHAAAAAVIPESSRLPLALAAWAALALVLHGRALGVGFTQPDLAALDTVLRTHLDALLRGGALPGDYAPLSRELYWWWWGRALQLDAVAFHVLNAAIAIAGGWLLFRAVERWADARAGLIAGLLWTAFPPLAMLLSLVSGGRELVAVLACAAAWVAFARGRWILAALACGAAALSGRETVGLPLVLLVADLVARPQDPPRPRLLRLLPAFVLGWGTALAIAHLGPGVTKPAPAGAHALWWLVRTWVPPGTLPSLMTVTREAPWAVLAALGLSVLAVPGVSRAKAGARPPKLGLLAIGGVAALGSLVPLALAGEPPRAERFAVAALGVALAGGALASAPSWLTRAVVALAALFSLGANGTLATRSAAPRFTPAAEVRAQSAVLSPLLGALRPWCRELGAVPRIFAAGMPPDSMLHLALDPGAPVVCRDPRVSVRFLAEMTADDAARPFGVLRLDPSRPSFQFEVADAQVRARVGEGLLVFARHAPAAACFESALAERPDDHELIYPTVAALAAAQRGAEARDRWAQARRAGSAPTPDTLAQRLLVGYEGADRASAEHEVARLAAAVSNDPTSASAHLDLGRALLQLGRARSGTLEISVACGIGRRSQDVYWLAQGYDAMGAKMEALEAYRASLAGGLDSTHYRTARERLLELLHEMGPSAFGSVTRP